MTTHFFGLTALGTQNTFASAAKKSRNLQIFDLEDFQKAWEKIHGIGALHGRRERMNDVMLALFHGPIPINDAPYIYDAFELRDYGTTDTISFTEFMKIMLQLRDEAEREEQEYEKSHPGEFNSAASFHETVRKCGKRKDLQDKQIVPLTCTQEFGWQTRSIRLERPTAFRKGSDITKFAAELIKNGVY